MPRPLACLFSPKAVLAKVVQIVCLLLSTAGLSLAMATPSVALISSVPGGAQLLLNGKNVGATPTDTTQRVRVAVPAGRHRLEAVLTQGMHEKYTTLTFAVLTGATHTFDLALGLERATPEFQQQTRQRFAGQSPKLEMLKIPAGRFQMGSEANWPNERPVRTVAIAGFELGKTEVTFDMWDICFANGGCSHLPNDHGWGRGNQPVIYVSWHDAKEFIAWLNRSQLKPGGKRFRLPTEAEWEYAARAGGKAGEPFSTGQCISTKQARYNGDHPGDNCPPGDYLRRAIPVASFAPNAFGLYDMHGNVKEWVQDCWNTPYAKAPKDGRAQTGGDCEQRMVRGGAWYAFAEAVRSARRYSDAPTYRNYGQGFRLAR